MSVKKVINRKSEAQDVCLAMLVAPGMAVSATLVQTEISQQLLDGLP